MHFPASSLVRPTGAALRSVALLLAMLAGVPACIPYTVGSTAQTVAPGETTHQTSWYTIPNGIRRPGDSVGVAFTGADTEWRHGVTERSDVGVRLLPGGVSGNYKYRFMDAAPGGMSAAYMVGGGLVNWAEHLHLEATLIASGHEGTAVVPFGGLRAMQVIPLTTHAVRDQPTLGAFGGLQLAIGNYVVRPELGIYHDPSALELRQRNIIIVPAITVQRPGRRVTVPTARFGVQPPASDTKPCPKRGRRQPAVAGAAGTNCR